MFMMTMPKTFKVGDTADCRINKQPARLTWRDPNTLVIEPDEARVIMAIDRETECITFFCGDPGCTAADYDVDADENFGGGFIVRSKTPEDLK
jgi:hypothetical protein